MTEDQLIKLKKLKPRIGLDKLNSIQSESKWNKKDETIPIYKDTEI